MKCNPGGWRELFSTVQQKHGVTPVPRGLSPGSLAHRSSFKAMEHWHLGVSTFGGNRQATLGHTLHCGSLSIDLSSIWAASLTCMSNSSSLSGQDTYAWSGWLCWGCLSSRSLQEARAGKAGKWQIPCGSWEYCLSAHIRYFGNPINI